MFKLQRQLNKQPSHSRERLDFRFSNFQLLQVPKGWDRLVMSIISVETGKAVAKLGKAPVRNGGCRWTETLLESLWIPLNTSPEETTECHFKIIFSAGSTKPGILGEVTLNMAHYVSSGVSASASFPLNRCNYETFMQVKIQCLTPRTNLRVVDSKYSHGEDIDTEHNDAGSISNVSDDSFAGSTASSSSQSLGSSSNRGKLNRKATGYSVSSSNRSIDYIEGSMGRGNTLLSDDECSVSNKSSLGSRALGPRENLRTNSNESAISSLKSASSKKLLETAEDTTEELRAEAKMWERNARKLMLDLDLLSKEFSDQSKKQADLVMELSAAYAEHDGLKKEIENLKILLEESKMKQALSDEFTLESESTSHIQKELENEIKYQQESNASLALQLKRSQESNLELVSILQELEETIEQQRSEIDSLSTLLLKSNDTEINTEGEIVDRQSLSLKLQQLQESETTLQTNVQVLEKALQEKNKELEDERTQNIQSLLNIEEKYKYELFLREEQIARLEPKLTGAHALVHHKVTGHNKDNDVDLIKEIEALRETVQELERDCNELTDENLELILKFKESKNNHILGSASSTLVSNDVPPISINSEISVSEEDEKLTQIRTSDYFPEFLRHLEMVSHNVQKPWYRGTPSSSEEYGSHLDSLIDVSRTDVTALDLWVQSIDGYLIELNKMLEMKITECEERLKNSELEIQHKDSVIAEAQVKLQSYCLMLQEYESLKTELLSGEALEFEDLQSNMLRKDQLDETLIQHERDFQAEVADLQEKTQIEGTLELELSESDITSNSLNNLQNKLAPTSSSLNSYISAKTIIKEKLAELKNEKCELESQLSVLKDENFLLQKQVSGLQSQLQNLAVERQSCQLELENSTKLAMSLQNDIRKFEIEMEAQKRELEWKVQEYEKQLLDTRNECELLKAKNQRLELSAVDLIKEKKQLEKSYAELMQKKLELHQYCSQMEAHLDVSQKCFFDCSKKVEDLEKDLSSMLETFSKVERSLYSELDELLEANRKDMERLGLKVILSNQMSEELKNLQQEVQQLNKKISTINEEKERIAFEAAEALSGALSAKARLERDLHEAEAKTELAENERDNLQTETESKVQGLSVELAAAKQSNETLVDENKKMSTLLAKCRAHEENSMSVVNDLELKLTVSNYERQQLIDQITSMKIELQKLPEFQNEVSVLNKELTECKFEKGKLEVILQSVSRNNEEMKAEKLSCIEKISSFEVAMTEFEICRQKRIALEEKIRQMEGDLAAKMTLCASNADLKKELCEIQAANELCQQKIRQLEQEKDNLSKRALALEESLRLIEEKQIPTQKVVVKDTSEYLSSTDQESELQEDFNNADKNLFLREEYNENSFLDGSDPTTKIQLLENELAHALDANDEHKNILQRFWSDGGMHVVAAKKSVVESEVVPEERGKRTKSSLEMELRELRERYFHMSLQYAEVEAQKEDLVMQLKTAKSGKRWFS